MLRLRCRGGAGFRVEAGGSTTETSNERRIMRALYDYIVFLPQSKACRSFQRSAPCVRAMERRANSVVVEGVSGGLAPAAVRLGVPAWSFGNRRRARTPRFILELQAPSTTHASRFTLDKKHSRRQPHTENAVSLCILSYGLARPRQLAYEGLCAKSVDYRHCTAAGARSAYPAAPLYSPQCDTNVAARLPARWTQWRWKDGAFDTGRLSPPRVLYELLHRYVYQPTID